jgi:hypothetical protein
MNFTNPNVLQFSFTTPTNVRTSAGVYDSNDRLIRTLWSGSAMPAGLVTRTWDGLDDDGVDVSRNDVYTIKVLQSTVQHVFDGVVGNSSYIANDHQHMHTAFGLFSCMATLGGKIHYAVGGNEGQYTFGSFTNAHPQVNIVDTPFRDVFVSPYIFAVDHQRLYFTTYGGFGNTKSFVYAIDLGTGAKTGFSLGANICLNYRTLPGDINFPDGQCYEDQYYPGALNPSDDLTNVPSGMAVQKNGPVLAVAYPTDGKIRLYDKIIGSELPSIETPLIANPAPISHTLTGNRLNQMAMTQDDELWVITSPTSVAKYSNLSTTPIKTAEFSIATNDPLAIAVDPTNGSIWIVDGGANQQVKNFSNTGVLLKTLGSLGGSVGTINLNNEQFNFYDTNGFQNSAITVDSQGNVWITDTGNDRMLKFRHSTYSVIDSIEYRRKFYNSNVDPGDPTRVFANFTEFSVDYSKPLTDPKSWNSTKNWLWAIPPELKTNPIVIDGGFSGFNNVVTLSNGRTYAQLGTGSSPSTGRSISVILELLPNGTVRRIPDIVDSPLISSVSPIGQSAPRNATDHQLCNDGNIVYSLIENSTQTVFRMQLQGFDDLGNPIWDTTPVVIASIPLTTTGWESGAIAYFSPTLFPTTSGGKVVFFQPSAGRIDDSQDPPIVYAVLGKHLGAVTLGGDDWAWLASPTGVIDYHGTFGGLFLDANNTVRSGVNYAGNSVRAVGANIIYGYHGEFYKQSQACQFMHFHETGLFVGQFGVPGWVKNFGVPEYDRSSVTRIPGSAGNAFSWNLIDRSGTLYLYSNDESTYGGVNRWRITNTGSIVIKSGSGKMGNKILVE